MFDREHRDLAHIPRWGITRRIKTQTVAEHSYFVSVYCLEIVELLGLGFTSKETLNLVHSALVHDNEEIWTGDIPGPAKRVLGVSTEEMARPRMVEIMPQHALAHSRVELSPLARSVLKVADRLDACLHLTDELQMGNSSIGWLYDSRTALGSNYEALRKAWFSLDVPKEDLDQGWSHVVRALERAAGVTSRILLQDSVR